MEINFIIVTFVLIVWDILTGLVSAWVTGTYKSTIMREGGKHKMMLLVAVVFGVLLDYSQTMVDFGFSVQATKLICSYISIMEICSSLENIDKGFPGALPKALTNLLSSAADKQGLNKKDEDEEDKDE